MGVNLTPDERRAAAVAIAEWLATYAQGPRPATYVDAFAALRKLEPERRI